MAIITRISRLFRADLNAVLDRIEAPDVLLRQALRDMEDDLAEDEQRLRRLEFQRTELAARRAELERALREIGDELDVCFAAEQEDLARAVVRRKLETQQLQQALTRRAEALDTDITGLQTRIADHRNRLQTFRQQAELLAEEQRACGADDAWPPDATGVRVPDADVEVALLREKQQRRRP